MDCADFRSSYRELINNKGWISAGEKYWEWIEHMDNCVSCRDWYLQKQVEERNIDPGAFPCIHVAYHSMGSGTQHISAWECPDITLVLENGVFGIPVRDGTESYIRINYCPWCGKGLYPGKEEVPSI